MKLKAPFPYFGGKKLAAELVWSRFGNVSNYIEPFCGSAAMLLCRPDPPRIETLNDLDCYVANFWRATSPAGDSDAVATYADWPVNEADLHARHRFLVLSPEASEFRQRMRTDPDYFDAKFAGWWCWGLCCWIGSGWCATTNETGSAEWNQRPDIGGWNGGGDGSRGVQSKPPADWEQRPSINKANGNGVQKLPILTWRSNRDTEKGVNRGPHKKRPRAHTENSNGEGGRLPGVIGSPLSQKKPLLNAGGNAVETPGRGIHGLNDANRPQLADEFSRGRGVNGNDAAGTCEQRRLWLLDWFGALRDRLRTVRVCCGDWRRVCDSPSVTTRLGITAVFLDPPYSTEAARDMNLYGHDSGTVAHEVRAYCLERGSDPLMRLALCGYEGEGHEELEASGWTVVAWKSHGGYGNRSTVGKRNSARERIWFSPHCLSGQAERMLFD